MKNIIYLFTMIIGFTFISCEPMDDIHEQLDAEIEASPITEGIEYTLVEDDYTNLDLEFPNFNTLDQAKELIPLYLTIAHPTLGKGSQAIITFDIYAPKPAQDSVVVYTVAEDEYPNEFGNFGGADEAITFLESKYPNAVDKMLVSLTYEFYSGGSASTVTNGFLYTSNNDFWSFIEGITAEEYLEMGEDYPNFSSVDEAETKLEIFLMNKYQYETFEEGEFKAIMYQYYAGEVQYGIAYYVYKNGVWKFYDNVITETLKFGHDGETWVPDNTIKYTLAPSDYAFIGNTFAAIYPEPAESAGNYNNFDRRSGNPAYWSDDMLLEAMIVLLEEINPSAEEGQKYEITFAIYNGAAGTESLKLIKQDGNWILNEQE